jgi:hypothetical protein
VYAGLIIALDIASRTGIAEGRPGEKPRLYSEVFRQDGDDYEDTFGRAVAWMARRLVAEGIVVEAPISSGQIGETNHDALIITKGLWAAMCGFARARRVMVRRVAVSTVRKHFLGRGDVPKERAKHEAKRVCQALGWEPPNLDAADAGALFHWAAHQWNPQATPKVDPLFLAAGAR